MADSGLIEKIGDYKARVDYALAALEEQEISKRFWEKDPSLWRQGIDGEKVINNRLGWLKVADAMAEKSDEIISFAEDVKNAGFTHAVLMGMGGSSLSPEVSRITFGSKSGYPHLIVLDSTVPSTVVDVEKEIDIEKTLFIVSTKSGGTVETLSAYKYFQEKLQAKKGANAGDSFVAITDPGSKLEQIATENKFRKLFLNPSDIGGRYSALSYFGLVPAAIIGADIKKLLNRAQDLATSCSADVPASENSAISLGVIMGEMALLGRNKLTLITSPEMSSFGLWVEQLVAESTGKNGAGVIPIDGEPIGDVNDYGDDRLFVYTKILSAPHADLDEKVEKISKSGQPVVTIEVEDEYDLGQEYLRWEIATGIASAVLGVNSFDEPNVKESKDNTNRLLSEFKTNGKLPDESPVLEEDGIKLYCDEETKVTLDRMRAIGPYKEESLLSYISAHLHQFQPGNYFALMAFIQSTPAVDQAFQKIRAHLLSAYSAASTLGYGPTFLHSTGQLHKGGPNSGVFIQFTADDACDVKIPEEKYTFSILKQSQSMGDAISLRSKGRPLIRIHLGKDAASGLNKIVNLINEAVKEQSEE